MECRSSTTSSSSSVTTSGVGRRIPKRMKDGSLYRLLHKIHERIQGFQYDLTPNRIFQYQFLYFHRYNTKNDIIIIVVVVILDMMTTTNRRRV